MKIFKRSLLILLIMIVLLCTSLGIYLYLSPMPGVFLLRHAFGGEGEIHNPPGYEEVQEKVEIQRDLTYPSEDGKNQYDLYLPKEYSGKLPIIVWVHGGAFVAGDKSGVENWGTMLAGGGYAVAAVNYEWAPEIAYPGQVRQVEECIAELQKQADDGLPIDMENVIVAGDSAGAHIAAQAGLLASNASYEEELGVVSRLDAKNLKGVLLYCGPYNVEKILNVDNKMMQFLASRIGWAMFGDKHWSEGHMIQTTTIKDYITSDYAPAFIADGNTGSFEQEGKELVQVLEEKGVPTQSLFFDKSHGEIGHEYQFDLTTQEGWETYTKTLEFLDGILAN